MKIYLYILIFSCCYISCAQSKKNEIHKNNITKVLFIGNSYLYFNSASEVFNAMASKKFPKKKIVTKLISGGGMTLKNHFQNKETLKIIQSEKWDYIILQEQSELDSGVFIDNVKYLGSMNPFFLSSKKFYNEIAKTGAKTAFLMTWSDKSNPKRQNYLTYAYSSIAKELNAILIPVGLTWNKERYNTKFDIYDTDGYHPSTYGSYLIASTIFSTLFKTSPKGIPGNLIGYSVNETGKKSFLKSKLSNLSNEDAEIIHTSSWTTVSALNTTNGYPKALPKPNKEYTIPTLPTEITLTENKLKGTWVGFSKFDFVSDGLKLTFSKLKNKLHITINILRNNTNISTTIVNQKLNKTGLLINFKDDTDRVRKLEIIKHGKYLRGIIVSTKGNYTKYDNIKFSKK